MRGLMIIILGFISSSMSVPVSKGDYGIYTADGGHQGVFIGHHDYYSPAFYDFGYGVHDPYHGTNFGHKETREGHVTTGEYYVNLPDGRLQRVTYIADEHGYRPTVTYVGDAVYPSHAIGY